MMKLKPHPTLYPSGYDVNGHCKFQMGAPGHTLENCYAFKNYVQDLVESKVVIFTPTIPNVKTNPMSAHAESSLNYIERVVRDKHEVDHYTGLNRKNDLQFLKKKLVQ